jgi:hypothetical protein
MERSGCDISASRGIFIKNLQGEKEVYLTLSKGSYLIPPSGWIALGSPVLFFLLSWCGSNVKLPWKGSFEGYEVVCGDGDESCPNTDFSGL